MDRRCATGPRGASDTSQGRAAIELHLTKLAEVKNRWDQAAAAATQILTA